jgi:hypothetical protein
MDKSPKVEVEKRIMEVDLSKEVGKSVMIRKLTTDFEWKLVQDYSTFKPQIHLDLSQKK